nr:hypothetical protein [Cronobacter dublinensis]
MKMLRVLAVGLLAWSTLAGAQTTVYEYPRAEDLPEDGTTFLTRDPALLNAFDNHLSAARFLRRGATGRTSASVSKPICISSA